MNFIMRNVRTCLQLNLLKKICQSQRPSKPPIDFSSSSNAQVSNEIKEFLSYAQTSWPSSSKPNDTEMKSDARSDITAKNPLSTKASPNQYSLLMQFTLSKITLIVFNCEPNLKCNKKIVMQFEDIIMNFNQRPNYHQLTLKVASGKGECFERLSFYDEYTKNENLGFHFHSDTEIHEKGERDSGVVQLLVTCADKIDVQSKWKVKIKPNLNSDARFLTEVNLKMQHLDLILDLELLAHFTGAFRLDEQPKSDAELLQKSVTSVDDLPLFDFQSKGIRIFFPISGNKKQCDVFILTIGEIKMIEPENKINRKPLRPDIYMKALQLGILDVYGTKVENRQYELLFQNISLCTGDWINVLDIHYKQQNSTHHDNPALEWNSGGAPISNKLDVEINTVFSGFNLSIVYAPSIIFENVLVCEEAIEFNCTNDMVLAMSINQLVLALQMYELYEQMMALLNHKSNPDFLVLNEITQEYVGISSDLFQGSPTSPKLRKTQSVDATPFKEDTFFSPHGSTLIGQLPRPRLQKRTLSLTHIEKRSIEDSGIESLGASNEKKRLKQKITQLKKQYQIKEIVLLPYEIYFNGGIFTFKLYRTESGLRPASPSGSPGKSLDTEPILTMVFDRPNIFVKQTNYEKTIKISLLDYKLLLGMEIPPQLRRQQQTIDVPIFETRPGESDHTGAKLPFIELKHVSSLTKPDEVDLKIEKPSKITMSHDKLQNLLEIYVKLMFPVQKRRESRVKLVPPKSVKKVNIYKMVKGLVAGLNRLNLTVAQMLLEISDGKNYDFKLIFSKFESCLNLVDRIERINFNSKLHNLILTEKGRTIIHPFTIQADLSISQETWKREPLLVLFLKSNYFQFDAHIHYYTDMILMQNAFEQILKKYETELKIIQNRSTALTVKEESNSGKLIPIQSKTPSMSTKSKQEHYEDDLRAGAFQFVETTSTAELPLPYQIQIYQNRDTSSVCWRYPQPRCLSQVKLFPVPIQFNKPTILECKLEYYNNVREMFVLVRNFILSDQDVTKLDIPNRIICSSIWRVTVIQKVVRNEDDSDIEDEMDEVSDSTEQKGESIFFIFLENEFRAFFLPLR